MILTVKRKPGGKAHHGLLRVNGSTMDCALGRSGITTQKREGDGATPAGRFPLLYGYYRDDRIFRPKTSLELFKIKADDGWCDDLNHPAYNSHVSLPFGASHEIMMRNDRLYDVCLVLDYNISTCAKGMGSAIFFHQTSEAFGPTEGCIAIEPDAMRKLLPWLNEATEVVVLND